MQSVPLEELFTKAHNTLRLSVKSRCSPTTLSRREHAWDRINHTKGC